MKKTDIRSLRNLVAVLGGSVFQQGGQWIASIPVGGINHEKPLHYSIKSERGALEELLYILDERLEWEQAKQEFLSELATEITETH